VWQRDNEAKKVNGKNPDGKTQAQRAGRAKKDRKNAAGLRHYAGKGRDSEVRWQKLSIQDDYPRTGSKVGMMSHIVTSWKNNIKVVK